MDSNFFDITRVNGRFHRSNQSVYNKNELERRKGISFFNSSRRIEGVKGGAIDQDGK
jgi:hypothetical protein